MPVGGSAASASRLSGLTCSTCWPSGTSTWSDSHRPLCGIPPGKSELHTHTYTHIYTYLNQAMLNQIHSTNSNQHFKNFKYLCVSDWSWLNPSFKSSHLGMILNVELQIYVCFLVIWNNSQGEKNLDRLLEEMYLAFCSKDEVPQTATSWSIQNLSSVFDPSSLETAVCSNSTVPKKHYLI